MVDLHGPQHSRRYDPPLPYPSEEMPTSTSFADIETFSSTSQDVLQQRVLDTKDTGSWAPSISSAPTPSFSIPNAISARLLLLTSSARSLISQSRTPPPADNHCALSPPHLQGSNYPLERYITDQEGSVPLSSLEGKHLPTPPISNISSAKSEPCHSTSSLQPVFKQIVEGYTKAAQGKGEASKQGKAENSRFSQAGSTQASKQPLKDSRKTGKTKKAAGHIGGDGSGDPSSGDDEDDGKKTDGKKNKEKKGTQAEKLAWPYPCWYHVVDASTKVGYYCFMDNARFPNPSRLEQHCAQKHGYENCAEDPEPELNKQLIFAEPAETAEPKKTNKPKKTVELDTTTDLENTAPSTQAKSVTERRGLCKACFAVFDDYETLEDHVKLHPPGARPDANIPSSIKYYIMMALFGHREDVKTIRKFIPTTDPENMRAREHGSRERASIATIVSPPAVDTSGNSISGARKRSKGSSGQDHQHKRVLSLQKFESFSPGNSTYQTPREGVSVSSPPLAKEYGSSQLGIPAASSRPPSGSSAPELEGDIPGMSPATGGIPAAPADGIASRPRTPHTPMANFQFSTEGEGCINPMQLIKTARAADSIVAGEDDPAQQFQNTMSEAENDAMEISEISFDSS